MQQTKWTQWTPPYDPRQLDSATVMEDEHHRLIQTADCGTRCPGCGICCAGYRDTITADYFGVEEYEDNLKMGRGGLLKQEDGGWYRIANCDATCPGYGRCCPPRDLRDFSGTVANARHVLLERDDSQRWEMRDALLILAHDGSAEAVEVLEAYVPRAHVRLEGFAECALEEGRYFASLPHNAEEERTMLKREVLQAWEERAINAHAEIFDLIEPELERLQYEAEIARRLLEKAQDDAARETWRIQVDVFDMLVGMKEDEQAKQQEELVLSEAMIDEIKADLENG